MNEQQSDRPLFPAPGQPPPPLPQPDHQASQPYSQLSYPQQPYPGGYFAPPQDRPTRHKGKLITGIVLIVVGALFLLVQASPATSGAQPDDGETGPAYMLGRLTAIFLFAVVPLVVGILLVSRSRRR